MWAFLRAGSKSEDIFDKFPVFFLSREVCLTMPNHEENMKKISVEILFLSWYQLQQGLVFER